MPTRHVKLSLSELFSAVIKYIGTLEGRKKNLRKGKKPFLIASSLVRAEADNNASHILDGIVVGVLL